MQYMIITLTTFLNYVQSQAVVESCDSKIYCQGDLLDTVQHKVKVYNDSKDFVDMIQIHDPDVTLANFQALLSATGNNPNINEVRKYLSDNFKSEGELEDWTPSDYKENPGFLSKIKDEKVREFAQSLVKIWPKLGRKIKEEVKQHQSRHSLLYVPNGFIVPGGRFREIYYWDSYWIILGLLISEMHDTVRGMLDNFAYLIDTYGFIPNGNRVYYLNRSQPPLFVKMVRTYMEFTRDEDWLKDNIKYLVKEMNWWLDNRLIEVTVKEQTYKLARYGVTSNTPRPESYQEDIVTCDNSKVKMEKGNCYRSVKSAAESGWDFSTRWFVMPQVRGRLMVYIDTLNIIPVDLNSFLCEAFKTMGYFHHMIGDMAEGDEWYKKASTWEKAMQAVLYNEEDGIWYDYNHWNKQQHKWFYPSNLTPLWSYLVYNNDTAATSELASRAIKYFQKHMDAGKYPGGIPTSTQDSGEQWDFPNAWPPLQDIIVTGMATARDYLGNQEANEIIKVWTEVWLQANMIGFEQTGSMFEKYDASAPGQYGGGGEYIVQSGFGWTNGVALSFIHSQYAGNHAKIRADLS